MLMPAKPPRITVNAVRALSGIAMGTDSMRSKASGIQAVRIGLTANTLTLAA